MLATIRVQKAFAVQARRVADELERLSAGEQPNARQLEISEAILDILNQMAAGGMKLGDEHDEASFEEMELADLKATMAPDERLVPLKPDEVKPVVVSERPMPQKKARKGVKAKGLFKKDS